MGARGRESSADLSVVAQNTTVAVHRPEPSPGLTAEQCLVWRSVVDRLPADWFPAETLPLLAQYCRHVVSANSIARMIASIEVGPAHGNVTMIGNDDEEGCLKDYDKLLAMQEREGRAMSSLATRMRLTQQATFDKERKKGKVGIKKPWQQ